MLSYFVIVWSSICPSKVLTAIMSNGEVGVSNKPTIFDYLNEDCWRAVLNYVPVKDIICSERVSSCWQRVVLVYLSSFRFLITNKDHNDCFGVAIDLPNVTSFEVDIDYWPSFLTWTNKLGTSVVGIHCTCMDTLKTVSENCPNLEGLAIFYPLIENQLQIPDVKNLKFLQKLGFTHINMSDQCLNEFINCLTLKELCICNNETMTGECLNNNRLKNLKSLILDYCPEMKLRHLVSAVDNFSELTKLILVDPTAKLHENLYIIIDKLPNLEYLHYVERDVNGEGFPYLDDFFKSICRLGRLKHFYIQGFLHDYDLELITYCCKELQSLELEECHVTPKGLVNACLNAGALTTLGLDSCWMITDGAIVACIRSCPRLTSLSVRYIRALSLRNVAKIVAARRESGANTPLRIFAHGTMLTYLNGNDRVAYKKEIIIDDSVRLKWW